MGSRPGTLPLAVLGRTSDPKAVLQAVAHRLEQVHPPALRAELTTACYILAGLILGHNDIQQMLQSQPMRESVTFQAILAEGRQVGREEGARAEALALVSRLLRHKFGQVPQRLDALSVAQLEALGEALLDWDSPAELDQWLQQQLGDG
ncbi:MAG: DUF4351 domain-containing protein [Gloeomargarita sp. SKYG98]|nr:DUF4351 domain-containing protein [Gloeomargarita sp. SKYG98]